MISMARLPPEERPTARDVSDAANGRSIQIAGQPADQCPYCGCGMFANRTTKLETRTIRYVNCRNAACGKRFVSRQPNATIVREVGES